MTKWKFGSIKLNVGDEDFIIVGSKDDQIITDDPSTSFPTQFMAFTCICGQGLRTERDDMRRAFRFKHPYYENCELVIPDEATAPATAIPLISFVGQWCSALHEDDN